MEYFPDTGMKNVLKKGVLFCWGNPGFCEPALAK
jgi:hypothetical protein